MASGCSAHTGLLPSQRAVRHFRVPHHGHPSRARRRGRALVWIPFTCSSRNRLLSDTLSPAVFAVRVSTFQGGFVAEKLVIQIIEIALFVPLIAFGSSRLGAFLLEEVEDDENAHFIGNSIKDIERKL